MITELAPEQLRIRLDPAELDFETTESVPPVEGIIGQPRALEALQFGLEMGDPTFHVYVAGRPGTGRTTAVVSFLEELAAGKATPSDWCYVNNFADSTTPRVCELPAGRGRTLAADIERLVDRARAEVPKAFETEEYSARKEEITGQFEEQRQALLDHLKEEARSAGFVVHTTPLGVSLIPTVQGRPLTEELARSLSAEFRAELEERQSEVQEKVQNTLKQIRDLERKAEEKVEELDREVVLFLVGGLVDDLIEKYEGLDSVVAYLGEVREALPAQKEVFQADTEGGLVVPPWLAQLPLRDFEVNVMVDRSDEKGAPVVIELNPTYTNLFGRVEKESRLGALYTDFTLVRPGAMHQANGGYLVLPVRELLLNYLSYDGLKRALRNREIDIEEPAERLGLTTTRTLRPEPVPLNVKVVLIGTPLLYHLLYLLDEDFKELFKVKAHFDDRMDRADHDVGDYVAFVRAVCEKENLPHMDREAVSRLVAHGSRLAEDQTKLTTRFADLADVVREAGHFARKAGSPRIAAKHVDLAVESRIYRSNLIEERIGEMIERGVLLIDTEGAVVGQINGLSVLDLGDYAFGRPSRITTSMALGQAGVVDIEREAKLGGPIHTKGVMILSGYLSDRFAVDYPLSLTARLVFEQSYSEVEGDSASGAELLALLSALSDLPLRQGMAVTGSVDQQGRMQAVGGINEKVEGFYHVCKLKGLDGEQGVVVPAANAENLMLREEVVEAVAAGRFHVWTVGTAEEGVELLTGVPAGRRGPDGAYPEGTVYRRIDDRLRDMAERMARFGRPELAAPEEEEEEEEAPEAAPAEGGDQE